MRVLLFAPALLLLASCGSYQYAGYEHDGIYSQENREAVTTNDHDESYEEALYYKQLFAQQADQLNYMAEGAVFTNVDDYSSVGNYEDEAFTQDGIAYQGGNAPWGEDRPDEIAINFYNNSPMMGLYMDPYFTGSFHPFLMDYRFGYGYGWNNWGYGYGYHNPWRWNMGFGWNNWGWNAGWAYHSPYHRYGNFYGNPYLSTRRNVAYMSGRRDSFSNYNSNARSNSQARSSRIQSYANSRGLRAERSSAVLRSNRTGNDNRTYSTRTSRVESAVRSNSRNSNTYSRSSNSNDRTRARTTQARTTRTVRSNDNSSQVRRSSSTSRSTPTVRSSSSSSRSSGTRSSGTSSSRSSRGRGN